MRKLKALLVVLLAASQIATAQTTENKWSIGAGTHAVDWLGAIRGRNFWQVSNWEWSIPISRVTVARNINKSFVADFAGSISIPNIDNARLDIDSEFFANVGVGLRYKFANDYLLNENSWFDPYLRVGVNYMHYDFSDAQDVYHKGHKDANGAYIPNPNLQEAYTSKNDFVNVATGVGFNFWFTEHIAFNWETSYNHSFRHNQYQDFFQHAAGVVVRFGKKDRDKDGVSDDNDACPDVAGPKSLNGCPDTDGDGILDKDDACPDVAGPESLNGCPDSDGDGVADKDDACPNEAGAVENKGCPWKDTDGDGVVDKDDECPNVPGLKRFNGCPDTDGDGIADNKDKCPKVAGTVALNGCPEDLTKEEAKAVYEKSRNILFHTGKSTLTNPSKTELDHVAKVFKQYPSLKFNIDGHTDSTGSAAFNKKLSKQRAEAVVKFLESKGVPAGNLTARGFGEEKPIATNKTAAGREENRRVEINKK